MALTSHSQNEVIFMATPAMGMLSPAVEFARRLVDHHPGSCLPPSSSPLSHTGPPYTPTPNPSSPPHHTTSASSSSPPRTLPHLITSTLTSPTSPLSIDQHKPNVKNAISNDSKRRVVVALFVDLFCSSITDVADELGIPSYLFFASPAGFLSFALDLPILDSQLASESLTELRIRGFANSVPRRVLHRVVMERGHGHSWYLQHARKL
ncbi:UDP-glucuronosyl/UDP-glucosyltransferase [Trema orientale]|uniref:UDP-glucuronosyl/UDP-glucosyltransferase n=1 Tax=Trema orientale TaxID=63057 RepID=A0A2P5BYY2_TREOI|nr:UDP-glucuronosyl/UDP-glucosyltransferase [Trema orientale]